MNWVLILVLLIIAINIISGYHRGFLRIVYSLVSWIIVMAFVLWATPFINTYLMEKTPVYGQIQQHCAEKVRESAQKTPGEGTDTPADGSEEAQKTIAQLGIQLPDTVLKHMTSKTGDVASEFLEASGVYDEIANEIAEFVVEGIAVILAIIAAQLLVHALSQLLGIVSHIPVLSGINRTLGIFAGGLYGLIIVWIAFYIIALCSTSELGAAVVSYIYESRLLTYLYENNLILTLIVQFI